MAENISVLPSGANRGIVGLVIVAGRFRITRVACGLSTVRLLLAEAVRELNGISTLNLPSVTEIVNESVCAAL